MSFPNILTALPKRRYQYGEYSVTLLSDINSNDSIDYLYIVAVLREGYNRPEVYITCEPQKLNDSLTYRIRVISENEEHNISEDPQWKNEQNFCEFALQGIQQMFNLSDEEPIQLS